MPEFEAIVKIKDDYGGRGWTKQKIAAVLLHFLKEAEMDVLEIIEIKILEKDADNPATDRKAKAA